ncbi:ABC transporter substrate-binding protein [Defluviimonas aestuarii]|uniref:ABC transporter substrate-binding protein n=1 Tax=Albidovulum aestuarii TaxID=1130726 RepID=UPI00249B0CB3|nr:ABC transporter substrate-binding protein [Defluviimonas aestuarii]MDI3336086.1 ABC transporter substrate-binding protein [Defluviimonas aestuarii]
MSNFTNGTGGLSRRGLLKGATALGAAGLILPASVRKAMAEPKRGGVLRIALASGNTTDSLDPATWDSTFVQSFNTARCNTLTEIAPDGTLVGELAESWEASADAVTWTFKIREGVTFHSGKAMTVDDVVASINYHRGEESKSAAKPYVDPITDIKADGQNVVITLSGGNADFPFILADYHLVVLPSADGKIDVTTTDGTGAYVLDSFEPGVSVKMSRNPNYFKSDRAWFDGIDALSIVDAAARQNALITGEVDVIDGVDLNTVSLLERAPGIKVLPVTGNQHFVFPMDTRLSPYDNNNIRQALKYGLDRDELVEKILRGFGSAGNDHPIGRGQRYFNTELEQKTYDPDKAKFYLKEAGMDSISVQLSAADAAFSGAVDSAVLYAERAAAAGINIEVVREPSDGYWDNVWMKKPFCASYWGGRPTEDLMFSVAYSAGAPWNDSFWDHARFNELLVSARSELDDDKRRQMYWEMQDICANEGGVVIPMFASYVNAHSDKVGVPEVIGTNQGLDGLRLYERWWFA